MHCLKLEDGSISCHEKAHDNKEFSCKNSKYCHDHKWWVVKSKPNSVFVMAITLKWSADCSKVLQNIYLIKRNLYEKEIDFFFVFGILNHGNLLLSLKLS